MRQENSRYTYARVKKNNLHSFKIILIFIIGLAGFSQLSYRITVQWLNSPIYLIEPFIVLLSICVWKSIKKDLKSSFSLQRPAIVAIISALWLFLVLIAVANGSLSEALSSGRPYLYAFYFGFAAAIFKTPSSRMVFVFMCGILCGEIANIIFSYSDYDFNGIIGVNVVAVFVIIAIAVFSENVIWQIIAFLLCGIVMAFSGYRFIIFTAILSLVIARSIIALRSGFVSGIFQYIKLVLCILSIGIIIAVVWHNFNVNKFTMYRIANRTTSLLGGDFSASQDIERLEKIQKSFSFDYTQLVIPKGFIMRAEDSVGLFNDTPILYFTETFGMFFGLVILGIIFAAGFTYLSKVIVRSKASPVDLVSGTFVFMFIAMLFFNGRFLYIAYESPLFGWIVGKWFSIYNISSCTDAYTIQGCMR